MKARLTKLAVETLEDRCVPATLAYGDINNDGREDMAVLTNPTTITVSLANPDGSYTVSATLKAPKNLPIGGVYVSDRNADGNLDVSGFGITNDVMYNHIWLGDGDGTFGNRDTYKSPKMWA